MDTAPAIVSLIHPHLPQPMYGCFASGEGGGHWNFRFCGFGHFLDQFFGFCTNKSSVFGFGDYCGFCSISLLVFSFSKIKSGLRICYSMQFVVFPEDMAFKDFNRLFCLRFSVLRFSIICCTVLPFLAYFNAPLLGLCYTMICI